MTENRGFFSSFNKWVVVAMIVALYSLVVLVALFTNQPPETMKMLLKDGGSGVELICFLIIFFWLIWFIAVPKSLLSAGSFM